MKHLLRSFLVIAALIGYALPSHATVYLDDFWADGSRAIQNLPTESAWFATGSAITAATSNMTMNVGGSAVLVVTYFTTNSTTLPARLNVGDTLLATFDLTFTGLPGANSSEGFRIGLFDFYDSTLSPKRVTSDASLSSSSGLGNGVQGYALFQNMATVFTNANLSPIDIRKRTNVTDSHLFSTSSDWTTLGVGPGNSVTGFPGFSNNVPYILQLSLQRTATNSLLVTVSWMNRLTGASLTTSFTDNAATNFSFDGIALRPQDNTTVAATTIFTEARVEVIPPGPPSISTDPQDQSIFVGQDASFAVLASGTAPLFYQWYTNNTSSALTGDTNSVLIITGAQLSDSGSYSVLVSNSFGSVTSAVAQLSVTIPDPPSIITQPQDQTVLPGASASFSVVAGGSEPLIYQWYFNTTTPVPNANDSTLTLTNIQPSAAGSYSVIVSNLAGVATSSNAVLTVNTNPVAPVFTSEPASQVVLAGDAVSFSAAAAGTAPIGYQWNKDGVAIPDKTSSTLTLPNAQASDDGSYTLTASNSVGSTTSDAALLTVTPPVPVPNSAYNLVGFGQGTTGGGVLPDTDPNYAKVFTATDLSTALLSKTVKIIEIMNDLDLGYNEIPAAAKAGSEPFRADSTPLLHPVLLTTGVSLIDIQKKNGLTIFSANGSTIRHAHLNIKDGSNIIVRNLKFDELWEWDESTKGKYDKNNWDFMTIGDSGSITGLWIDHCTFTKAYDGITDIKNGSAGITISWCKYTGDDGATNPNSWVWQQINALESSKTSYTMYNFLRNNGFSSTDVVAICQGHDKTHLIGANDLASDNALHTVTLHHEWFINPWDRLPRLRAGNVHDYNLYVDDTVGLVARNLRNARAAAMPVANQGTLNNVYDFQVFLNGSISTENGATLVEKSVYLDTVTPLRNNQTDPSDPAYTGKIKALDTIYLNPANGTTVRGNSTDPGSQLGPFQAPIIAFSWNLPGGVLPYTYNMDDPSQLKGIVTSPTAGAGAGVLTWNKTNWLVTSYAPTGPVIAANPQGVAVAAGQTVSFVVIAGGSAPLSYQWYFNTNSPIANATNSTLTVTNVQAGNVGAYSVVVGNSINATNSAFATLTVTGGGTAPVASFTASPTSGTEPLGVTFTDTSSGPPISNYWNLGDGTLVTNGTAASFGHTYAAGIYTVTLLASNAVGTSTLVSNNLISVVTALQAWQLHYFGCTNCSQAQPNADPYGMCISNTNQFLLGLNPVNPASLFRILSVVPQGNDMVITWTAGGGPTNVVQATGGDANGGYWTNFTDLSGPIAMPGSGDATNNYHHTGGAANPSRYYRIRLGP